MTRVTFSGAVVSAKASTDQPDLTTPVKIGICLPWTREATTQTERFRPREMFLFAKAIIFLLVALHRPVSVDATVRHELSANEKTASKYHVSLRHNRNLQSTYNEIDSVVRRVLPRFRLDLLPTPQHLTIDDENTLIGIMEDVLTAYVKSKSPWYPEPNTSLDYVLLAGIESDDWYSYTGGQDLAASTITNTTVLTFKGGVAYFRGVAAPSSSQVTAWVEAGLEQMLPSALTGTPYSYIQTVTFTPTTLPPSQAPNVQYTDTSQQIQQSQSSDSSSKGIISGTVVGGFALIAVAMAALFLIKRRSRKPPQEIPSKAPSMRLDGSSSISQVGSDLTNVPPRQQKELEVPVVAAPVMLLPPTLPAPMRLTDDDDASSFTASTRTDHSNMVPPKLGVAKRPIAATESFERDRPMALRKDMLDSSWNRSSSPSRLHSSPGRQIIHNDTVLQPSYFSASGERIKRKKEPRAKADAKEEEWYFSESKEEVGKKGFRFESANGGNEGEEVFLVPPTSPRSNTRSPPPADSTHSIV
jgi:hypothetical protein